MTWTFEKILFNICSLRFQTKWDLPVGYILTHLGINREYSMKFKFYKMKAWQEVSDCCGETSFRKLILKRYKQHALSNLVKDCSLKLFNGYKEYCCRLYLPLEDEWVPKSEFRGFF